MKRIALGAGIVLLAALLLLTGLYSLRSVLIAPFLKKTIEQTVAARTGLKVRLEQVSGTFLTELEVLGLEAGSSAPDQSPVRSLSLRRGVFHYSLLDLLHGGEAFLSHLDVTLQGLKVKLDLDRLPPGKKDEGRWEPFSPTLFPDLTITDSALEVHRSGLQVMLGGLQARLQPSSSPQAPVELALRSTAFRMSHPALQEQSGTLAARLAYDAESLLLPELTLNGQPLAGPIRVALPSSSGTGYVWEGTLGLLHGQTKVRGSFQDGLLTLETQAEQLHLERLAGMLAREDLHFGGTINTEASLTWQTNQPFAQATAHVSLALTKAMLRSVQVDQAGLEAAAAGGRLTVHRLLGQAGPNRVEVRDIGFPFAAVLAGKWQALLKGSPGKFSATIKDLPALLTMAGVRLPRLEQEIPPHTLRLAGTLGGRQLQVTEGFLTTPSGRVEIETGSMELPPGNTLASPELRSTLRIRIPELSELGVLFGQPTLQGAAHGRVEVEGRLPEIQTSAALQGENLRFRGQPLGHLTLAARADNASLAISSLSWQQGADHLTAQGKIFFKKRRLEDIHLDFNLTEVGDYADLLQPSLEISGSVQGSLRASGPFAAPAAKLQAEASNAVLAGYAVSHASAEVQSEGRHLLVRSLHATTDQGDIELAATVERGPDHLNYSGRLEALSYSAPGGDSLRLQKAASFAIDLRGRYEIEPLILEGPLGRVEAGGRLARHASSNFHLAIAGLSGNGWLKLLVADRFSFEGLALQMRLTGPLEKPQITAHGSIARLQQAEVPFPLKTAFVLAYSPAGLKIERLEVLGGEQLELTLSGSLPLDPLAPDLFLPGPLTISGRFQVPQLATLRPFLPAALFLRGAAGGDLELSGSWENPVGRLHLQGWDVTMHHDSLPEPPGALTLACELEVQGSRYRLNGLQATSAFLTFSGEGEWLEGPPLRQVLRGKGLKPSGRVAAKGRLQMDSIGWLARENTSIRRLGGAVQADLTVEGPIKDPQVKGEFRLTDGELHTSAALPAIQNFSLRAAIEGQSLRVLEGQGELGSAPFRLSGAIHRRLGAGLLFDVRLEGRNLLLFRNEWMGVRADSYLTVKGPWSSLGVTGRLAVSDGYYRKDVDFLGLLRGREKPVPEKGLQLFSIREGPLSRMHFQVEISSTNPFRVHNNLVRGSMRPELTLTGTGEVPALVGRIYVDDTRIMLPTGNLSVQSGLVTFPEEQPFRPRIDLAAQSTMRGYDISLQIEGPYNQPVVTLSSNPPLADDDLLLLLLAGKTPRTATGRETAAAGGKNIAVYFGKGLLAKWLGSSSPENDESFFERLELEIGRGLTRQGSETLDARFKVAEDLLGKEDTVYLTAERDVYDDYNVGVKIVFQFQ